MKKAELAKAEAEALKKDFRAKLDSLEKNKLQTIEQAKVEAEALKNKIIEEAKEASQRIIEDAKNTAQYEVEKAKIQLREELLNASIAEAKEGLKKKKDSAEMDALDKHFVSKIQVVQ
ncbi:MAG: hypothetical protein R2827_01760 [Bdellovibrionales bacterium]